MKKKLPILSAMLFLSILPMAIFAACDKDTHSYLNVKVINAENRKPISGVAVKIYQSGGHRDYINVIGYTDGAGEFSYRFDTPGNVNIKAMLPIIRLDSAYTPPVIDTIGFFRGETVGRLIDGKTVTREIPFTGQSYNRAETEIWWNN